MLVAHFTKQAISAPEIVRQAVDAPIASREALTVLGFILYSMRPGPLPADARWVAQAEVETARAALTAAASSPTTQLREILRQLRWDAAIPDTAQIGAVIAQRQSQASAIPEGSVASYRPEPRFLPGRTRYPLVFGGSEYAVTVRPINGRPNLNTISRTALVRILEHHGFPRARAEALATSITAWRTGAEFVAGRAMDESFYQSHQWSYGPKRAPFASWDEVAYVRGVDRQTFDFLRARFTIFGRLSTVHVDYVDPTVIAVLSDLPIEVVQRAIKHLIDPEPLQRTVGLGDIIGTRDAAAFEAVAGRTNADDDPVMVVIDGRGGRTTAVYDVRNRRILDQWFDAPDVSRPAS